MNVLPAVLLQTDSSPNGGVDVPILPAIIALAGLTAVVILSISALQRARPRRGPRAEKRPRERSPAPSITMTPAVAPPPVYRKAPVAILFNMIKPDLPDVWGLGDKAIITFRLEDKGLMGQRQIPGLAATIGGENVPLVFFRGEARVERTFNAPDLVEIVAELRVKGEKTPRRTTRTLKVVNYREEIAEVFDGFKGRVSATITPLRPDATPWEIYDAILDASPTIDRSRLRQVVAGFEEAKFSNHPVGRDTYERVLVAARELQMAEA